MTKLYELAEMGQANWLDQIDRGLIASGKLKNLVSALSSEQARR
jgi:hypothetical protein